MKVIPELTVEFSEADCDDGPLTIWLTDSAITVRKGTADSVSVSHADFGRIVDQLALFQKMSAVVEQPDPIPGQIKPDGTIWVGEPPADFQ